jgi:hypothetical protein
MTFAEFRSFQRAKDQAHVVKAQLRSDAMRSDGRAAAKAAHLQHFAFR